MTVKDSQFLSSEPNREPSKYEISFTCHDVLLGRSTIQITFIRPAVSSNYHLHTNGQTTDTIHESGTYALWSAQDCELATAFMVTSAISSS